MLLGIIVIVLVGGIIYYYYSSKIGKSTNTSSSVKKQEEPNPFSEEELAEVEKMVTQAYENMHNDDYKPLYPLSNLGLTISSIIHPKILTDVIKSTPKEIGEWFYSAIDIANKKAYFRLNLEAYAYYGAKFPQKIWNYFDDHGYLMDLSDAKSIYR